MAMTDAVKRKEPEPETEEKTEDKPEKAEAASAGSTVATEASTPAPKAAPKAKAKAKAKGEPDAKRLKPTPPDPATIRKQVEYYLSDENLRYDKFFAEKIAENKEGWLDMSLILSCNKMKQMRATKEDVVASLKGSTLEINPEGNAVRRPGNAALPALEAKPAHQKKTSIHAHDGGVVSVFKSIPEEQSWTQIKQQLQEKLPPKVSIWFVSEVTDKNQCFVATSPFENDIAFFEELSLEVGGVTIKSEVCHAEVLQAALKLMPKHVRDKREKESRKRQKERNRPIAIGTQRFVNVAALRGRVKEILNSRSEGEMLKPDGSDFKLVKALLEYHPKGPEKSQGLVGIKVAKSAQGDSRCFYMTKSDGVEEDFSAKKCLDAIEQNPPYVKPEPKEAKDAVKKKETPAGPAAPDAAGEAPKAATEEPAASTPASEAKEAAPAAAASAGGEEPEGA